MRAFRQPNALDRLSTEARVLYTAFAVFMLAAYGTALWLYADNDLGLGLEGARVAAHFRGEDAAASKTEDREPDATPPNPPGPSVHLPEGEGVAPLHLGKTPRQLVESFHFHAFSMPVVLLVLAHIFMMCGLSLRLRLVVIIIAHLATFVHLVAPLLVRFVGAGFGALFGISALLMAGTWLFMTAWPIWEMWRPGRAPSEPFAGM